MTEAGPSMFNGSPQSLEDFITRQFTSLALEVPEDDVEYIARLVEEEDLPEEDKVEGVKGMMEGFLPPEQPPSTESLDTSISDILSYWHTLKSAADEADAAARAAAEEEADNNDDEGDGAYGDGQSDGSSSGEEEEGEAKGARAARKKLLASLTPEELAAAQKRALLRQYGYVEDSDIATTDGPDPSGPPRGLTLLARQEEKAKSDRRELIERAILMEGKRRKRKNRQKEQIDLMAPNLNKEKVQLKGQMMREKARQEANKVRDRDKLALEKQRENEKKKLEEKRKKAQKGERRA